ncbi:MAG: hypothetical protein KA117_01100, partial [Verrucomicrobia bacterium]|nr:hypothetical protein [Verrucomicrobiota bacterium]
LNRPVDPQRAQDQGGRDQDASPVGFELHQWESLLCGSPPSPRLAAGQRQPGVNAPGPNRMIP